MASIIYIPDDFQIYGSTTRLPKERFLAGALTQLPEVWLLKSMSFIQIQRENGASALIPTSRKANPTELEGAGASPGLVAQQPSQPSPNAFPTNQFSGCRT